jgi:hypothetical protein
VPQRWVSSLRREQVSSGCVVVACRRSVRAYEMASCNGRRRSGQVIDPTVL